jgi:AcrR family transcriptional regulator
VGREDQDKVIERCLGAFVGEGMLDLSLDQLAAQVGVSKRMLIHYFGGREEIEERAMTLLEDKLRAQFAPETFPRGVSAKRVVTALWERTTAPEAKGVLLLVMDLSRRAWSGSARARAFYEEQQRLWVELLLRFLPDRVVVEHVLQTFQGAVLAYLVTGDRERGLRALMRVLKGRS